jgi:hypothetical protein
MPWPAAALDRSGQPPLQLHLSALDRLVSPREMENNPTSIIMPTLLWMKNICRALCMPSFQIHTPFFFSKSLAIAGIIDLRRI